jgi:hypothetical protein
MPVQASLVLIGSLKHVEDIVSILDDLTTQPRSAPGRSLEKLTELLCCLLHLTPVKCLVRSSKPGGYEVQMLAQEDHLPPNRWLLQCIDAEYISIDMIATAVGRGFLDSPHYLLTATSGRISSQAREYAAITSRQLHLPGFAIMLIDGEDLRALAGNATTIENLIRRELDRSAVRPFPLPIVSWR